MTDDKILNNRLEILGRLTASVMHEIRNSLSALNLNLEYLLLLKEELPQEVNETLISSASATERIRYLTENLLQFSKKSNDDFEYVSINHISIDAVDLLKLKARRKNIVIESNYDENIPDLFINRNKIFQVFMNLIINAIDACDNKGNIKIKTYPDYSEECKQIVWEVEDNGCGIDETHKEHIFSEFFTNKENGTGLGLSVCKKLLNEHSSGFSFESELGKGTKFFIKFKIKQPEI